MSFDHNWDSLNINKFQTAFNHFVFFAKSVAGASAPDQFLGVAAACSRISRRMHEQGASLRAIGAESGVSRSSGSWRKAINCIKVVIQQPKR